jgi:hypothetical protein
MQIHESSPLDLASEEAERLPCMCTLLDMGADVNARDKNGELRASRVARRSKALHRSDHGLYHNQRDITRSSNSLWRAGHLQADLGHQLNCVSSDTLVQLASGWSRRVLRGAVWWVIFRRPHDSTFVSRARWGVAARRPDRNWGENSGNKKWWV